MSLCFDVLITIYESIKVVINSVRCVRERDKKREKTEAKSQMSFCYLLFQVCRFVFVQMELSLQLKGCILNQKANLKIFFPFGRSLFSSSQLVLTLNFNKFTEILEFVTMKKKNEFQCKFGLLIYESKSRFIVKCQAFSSSFLFQKECEKKKQFDYKSTSLGIPLNTIIHEFVAVLKQFPGAVQRAVAMILHCIWNAF